MCMGISSASNWTWNVSPFSAARNATKFHSETNNISQFLISFFTSFITAAIDYRYGYIFAGCTAASIPIVYFFLEEHQGRSLEEIETMYLLRVPPWKSSKWVAPEGEDLVTADALYLNRGASAINKQDAAGMEGEQRVEKLPEATDQHGIHDISGHGAEPEASGVRGASVSG